MDEACPLPPVDAAPSAPVADDPDRRRALRRFHLGDPDAAVPASAEPLLPLALAPYRGVAAGGGWPLLLDLDGEPFATPSDAAGAAAPAETSEPTSDEAPEAVPVSRALRVDFDRDAPLEILHRAAERRSRRAHRRFAQRAAELAAAAGALIEADRGRRPEKVAGGEQVGRLGALGARFVDAEKLAGIVAHRRAGDPLPEERRNRLEKALALVAGTVPPEAEPHWFLPRGLAPRALPGTVRFVEDPCVAATRGFDRVAAEVAGRVRAARLLALEAANALDPERHLPWLDRLDWRGFDADELALVPPVFALVRRSDLVGGGLAGLSRLLLSGRPVQVVVIEDDGERSGATRFEPTLLGIAHREAFVHQGSVASPLALAEGIARAVDSGRSALHVIDAPADLPEGIDPWLVAASRVAGRAAPLALYDPDAGGSWSRRLRIDDNPALDADWPAGPVPGAEPKAGEGGGEFTFADAALLDPRWRGDFAPAPDGERDLMPLARWLELPAEEAMRRLPTVRALDGDGEVELVVTRALASAARDRLDFWRHLEELAGVRAEAVEEAAARARAEAEEKAGRERSELERAQTAELERVRADADAAAAGRIVQALIALGGGEPVAIGALEAPAAGTAPAAAEAAAEGAPESAVEAPAAVREDAWIDTALCTSCDECVRKFPAIFVYNADKQAVIKDPRGGSFRDLVMAAAACTARVIHPGKPWDPAERDLQKWVERAEEYQ